MTQKDLLDRLETDMRALLEQVRAEFSHLPSEALQVRAAADQWNILECFAHLNAFFDDYLAPMELAIHKAKARRWPPADAIEYRGRGKRAIRKATYATGKKYKTPKHYNFLQQPLGPEMVKAFIINGEMMLKIIKNAREIDVNQATIQKARSLFGSYSLANLLEFLITHAQRHVIQAGKLIRS